jgi:ribosomal protein S18 acetylase RimI-like enzyme
MTMDTMTATGRIVRLTEKDVPDAAALLTRAFDHDPFNRHLFLDDESRRRVYQALTQPAVARAIPYGHAFAVADEATLRGLAIWGPPPHVILPSGPSLRMLPAIGRDLAPAIGAIPVLARLGVGSPQQIASWSRGKKRAAAEARREPRWHLAALATDPAHQRRGTAGRLLRHMLERADADRLGVWLETTDPRNVALYERYGFGTLAYVEGPAFLPDWWTMVRPPGG